MKSLKLSQITLTNKTDGFVMETFNIDPRRLSSSIKLSVVSAYGIQPSACSFFEIEVFGTIPGIRLPIVARHYEADLQRQV